MARHEIGDYIHYQFENYEKYGLNQSIKGLEQNPNLFAVLNEQKKNIKAQIEKRKQKYGNKLDKKNIETQLNFYFDARRGNVSQDLKNSLTQEELNIIEQAIVKYFGEKADKLNIDKDTLASSIVSKDFNVGVLKAKRKNGETLIEAIKRTNRLGLGNNPSVKVSTVQERINILLNIRDKLARKDKDNSKKLIDSINSLSKQWTDLKRSLSPDGTVKSLSKNKTFSVEEHRNFIDEINNLISSFLSGSSTLHGEYAEAIIVATNYMINAKANEVTGNLLDGVLEALKKNIKGQETSVKGLLTANFSSDFVDIEQVVAGTPYASTKMRTEQGFFSTKMTQDKVDVEIQIDGLNIPGSVKNYNLSNVYYKDVHLLSGRSLIALVQEYGEFVNHYLNIMAEHGGNRDSSAAQIDAAVHVMKLTILLKAIAGGVETNKGRSKEADLFIINDNSIGQFKIYYINDILDIVEKSIDLLKIEGYDKNSARLSNNFVGKSGDYDRNNARQRISNLLARLHNMALEVSIDKSVFFQNKS